MAKMILTNGYYAAEKGSWNWLTSGDSKFADNTNITFWFADLPNMTNGQYMFSICKNLRSFEGDLSSLTHGTNMFQYCEKLTECNTTLPNLEIGGANYAGMFYNCTGLTSWNIDLPALTNGTFMFYNCDNLTSFSGDLSNLTNGSQMFGNSTYNCTKLDLASVQHIANTINDLTAAGTTGTIHIGMQKSLQSDDETAPINIALAAIRAKGWTVNELYSSN